MRKKIIIGNWKMNKTTKDINEFFDNFIINNNELKQDLLYGIAAPACYLKTCIEKRNNPNFIIAAQDVSFNDFGAFTGEICATMLKDMDVKYAIVGHSERRIYHHETNEEVNKKALKLIENNITPIICVGENLDEYEKNKSKEVVSRQVIESTKNLDFSKIIIAYEPVWAIGTGKVATYEYAQEMCKIIRNITSENTLIQYGGSVTPNTINELLNQEDIDGALVGGASLKVDSFLQLIKK